MKSDTVPSPEVQKEIVDRAAWEQLADGAEDLRAQVAQGIDGDKAQKIVDLLDQVTASLHTHAAHKRRIEDLWVEKDNPP